jgi:hypothetical protein
MSDEFTTALPAAPGGVALLASLEDSVRDDVPWFETPDDSRRSAVDATTEAIRSMGFGELARHAVMAGDRVAGPWNSQAPARLAAAYRLAPKREPIAEAIARRFTAELRTDLATTAQEWWTGDSDGRYVGPRLRDHRQVYCCGEFCSSGLWTVTDPPIETHDELACVWELDDHAPVGRWQLPTRPSARVYEIHAVADWVELVARYPHRIGPTHSGWELPGPNQHRHEVAELIDASDGRAARTDVQVAMPDWVAVAERYDAVHLSWAGMLTSEGHVTPVPELGPNVVTLLRYWFSERTLWLNDVFETPEPLPAPDLDPELNGRGGVSTIDDADRQAADSATLVALLGRDPFAPAATPPDSV